MDVSNKPAAIQVATGLCQRHLAGAAVVAQEEPREEEATRQKEFLEKVVVSQKSQLQQLEKLQKLNCVKMMRDNKVRSELLLASF